MKTLAAKSMWGTVSAWFEDDMDQVEDIWDNAWDSMIGKADKAWDGFLNSAINRAYSGLGDIFDKAVWEPATDWMSGALGLSDVSFNFTGRLEDFFAALEMGDTLGEALHTANITDLFSGGGGVAGLFESLGSGISSWFGGGGVPTAISEGWGITAGVTEMGVTAAEMATAINGVPPAIAEGWAVATEAASSMGSQASSLAGMAGLASPLGAFGLALGPGLLGMGLSQMGFLMDGPITPEEAVSNFFGDDNQIGGGPGGSLAVLEHWSQRMDEITQSMGVVTQELGLFGEASQKAWGDFERLGTVAGYTDEQLDAVCNSLDENTQMMLTSGEAADTLGGEVELLVQQMNAAANSFSMTGHETMRYNDRIDELASRLGLTGDAVEQFRAAIWGLSEGFSSGGEEATAFASSLDQFVAGTLGSITAGAEGGAEAIRELIDSMRGVSGASSGVVARALGKGESSLTFVDTARGGQVDELGLYIGGSNNNAEYGYYHQGGVVRGWPRAHAGALISSLARDEVPIVARRGEYVVRAESVTAASLPALKALNQGGAAPGGDMTVNFDININGNVMGNDDQIEDMVRLIESRLRHLQNSRWGG